MGSEGESEYGKFEEKVKRSVFVDSLSPQVTEAVIKSAFEQYVNVTNIHFIPNYTEPFYNSKCALVELETQKHAEAILDLLSTSPFMMSGMPRPVRGRPAEPEMFDYRPVKPGRRIRLCWVDPKDPDFQVAQRLKNLAKKHVAEQSVLLKKQLEEEEKLSNHQNDTLKAHYQKYDMMDAVLAEGTTKRLAKRYGVNLTEDKGH